MSSSLKSLPDDLVMDIVSRLGFKKVTTLKCISKSWKTQIESKNFRLLSPSMIFSRPNPHGIVNMIRPSSENSNELLYIEKNLPQAFPESNIRVVGSCNGVLCILHYSPQLNLVLCNPLFKNCTINVPRPPWDNCIPGSYLVYCLFGLGYDAIITDDYKVVWLEVHCKGGRASPRVGVFSLKSRTWTKLCKLPNLGILSRHHPYGFHEACSGLVVKVHWILDDDHIISLNLTSDVFQELPVPSTSDGHAILNIGTLDERLCLTTRKIYYEDGDNGRRRCWDYDLWIMKTYGIKDSWMRIRLELNKEHCYSQLVPVANRYCVDELTRGDNKQIIMMWAHSGGKNVLLYYDVEEKSLADAVIYDKWNISEAFHYVETMELLSSGKAKTTSDDDRTHKKRRFLDVTSEETKEFNLEAGTNKA